MSSLTLIRNYRKSLGLPKAEPLHLDFMPRDMSIMNGYQLLESLSQGAPSWKRGLSIFQFLNLRNLINSMRDDIRQDSTFRTQRTLRQIGLKKICNSELKYLLRLSKCNDLAFLWFLLELKYGAPPKESYSPDEQLIMSAIAHLDMIPTLQELDKILPPGNKSPVDPRKIKRATTIKRTLAEYKNCSIGMKHKYTPPDKFKPYFDMKTVPIPYGKPLVIDWASITVFLKFYENYTDPNYIVPNMSSRWFAKYDYADIEPNTLKKEFSRSSIHSHGDIGDIHPVNEYNNVKWLESSLENKLKANAIKYLTKLNKSAREKVVEKLELSITRHLHEFYRTSKKMRMQRLLYMSSRNNKKHMPIPRISQQSTRTSIDKAKAEVINSNDCSATIPKYFQNVTNHTPYHFNYHEIFSFEQNDFNVRKELCNALRREQQDLNEALKIKENLRLNDLKSVSTDAFYDGNDSFLMHNLLRDALEFISKNPKFVLPALPEVYKISILREFVYRRYGKKYTRDERKKFYQLYLKTIRTAKTCWRDIHIPPTTPLFSFKTYKCYDYANELTEKWKTIYNARVEKMIMDYARLLWQGNHAMHLGQDNNLVYFSYMPARSKDGHHLPMKSDFPVLKKDTRNLRKM